MTVIKTVEAMFVGLEQQVTGFVTRPQQLEMANLIAHKLDPNRMDERVIVIDAPTGVGKTLAYLVGVLSQALKDNKVVVVSTATTNLQSQLINNDLPMLVKALGHPLHYAIAKGRGRYVCVTKLNQSAGNKTQAILPLEKVVAIHHVQDELALAAMRKALVSGEWDGDRDNWPDNVSRALWAKLSTDSDSCLAKSCADYATCPFFNMKRRQIGAQLIVANHDVVLCDATLGGGVLLPAMKEVVHVIDEAHALPKKALEHSARKLNFSDVKKACEQADTVFKRLPVLLKHRGAEVSDLVNLSNNELDQLIDCFINLEAVLMVQDCVKQLSSEHQQEPIIAWKSPLLTMLMPMIEALWASLDLIRKRLNVFAMWLKEAVDTKSISRDVGERFFIIVGGLLGTFQQVSECIGLYLAVGNDEQVPNVRWLSFSAHSVPSCLELHASPMVASSFLAKKLWNKVSGAVLTSATLKGLGSFARFKDDCGLQGISAADFHAVSSPFKYYQQATLRLAAMRFEPSSDSAQAWLNELVTALPHAIAEKEGTLVLFTSKVVMNTVYQQLSPLMKARILLQDADLSPQKMVDKHKARIQAGEGSVIFGMDRFAEGVDLPGDYCTHVIITRIPFPTFHRPVDREKQAWFKQRGLNPFFNLSLPMASIRLIQSCGRLLRRETDQGRITVMDKRLQVKQYGETLLHHLPNYRVLRNVDLTAQEEGVHGKVV